MYEGRFFVSAVVMVWCLTEIASNLGHFINLCWELRTCYGRRRRRRRRKGGGGEKKKKKKKKKKKNAEMPWTSSFKFTHFSFITSFSVGENHNPAFSTALSYSKIFLLVRLFRLVCVVLSMVVRDQHFAVQLPDLCHSSLYIIRLVYIFNFVVKCSCVCTLVHTVTCLYTRNLNERDR